MHGVVAARAAGPGGDGHGRADADPVGPRRPITPPSFAERTAAILGTRSRVVSFAHVGHGVAEATPCGERVVAAFLRAPTTEVDAGCVVDVPPVAFR